MPENLVENVTSLLARLTELVLDRSAWETASRRARAQAQARSLPRVIADYYEPMRLRALRDCGCP